MGENGTFLQQLLQQGIGFGLGTRTQQSSPHLDSLSSTTAGTLHGLVWLERLIPQPNIHSTATIQWPVRLEDRTHLPNSNTHIRSLLEKHHYMEQVHVKDTLSSKTIKDWNFSRPASHLHKKESIRTYSTKGTKMLVLCQIKFPLGKSTHLLKGH